MTPAAPPASGQYHREPYKGGTFWFCPWNCYKITSWPSGRSRRSRFRTLKAARRHVRREHG